MRIQRRHNTLFRASGTCGKQVFREGTSVSIKEKLRVSGSVHMLALGVLALAFALGGYYLSSVNRSAVQGYHMRSVEKEINALKQENASLKITEADLKSLHRIEAAGEELQMQKTDEARYLEAHGPVAMR